MHVPSEIIAVGALVDRTKSHSSVDMVPGDCREVHMPNEAKPFITLWSLAGQNAELANKIWNYLLKDSKRVLQQPGRRIAIRKHSADLLDKGTDDEIETLLADNFFDEFGSFEIHITGPGANSWIACQRFIDAPWNP